MNNDFLKISLNQGKQFKKYQKKFNNSIIKNSSKDNEKVNKKREGFVNNEQETMLRKKEDGYKSVLENQERGTNLVNSLNKRDIDELKKLESTYNDLIQQYISIQKSISDSTLAKIDRTSPNNPYLNKTIRFNNGSIGYVTNQGIVKIYGDDDIYTTTAGKNGCPGPSPTINIDLDFSNYSVEGSIIPTSPQLITGTQMIKGQSCGNEGSNVFVNKIINDSNVNYEGCYADNSTSPLMTFVGDSPTSNAAGSYTYEQCKEAAIDSYNQYFALQGVNPSTSKGYCAVSNNLQVSTSLGIGMVPSSQTILWDSKTYGNNPGSTVSFINGSISVLNSSGAAIFSTPIRSPTPSNYIGCYSDKSARAMPLYNNGAHKYSNSQCQQIAQSQGATYYGIQDSKSGLKAQCALSSNLMDSQKYGLANNCTQISDGSWSGGGWSNAIYSTLTPSDNYYLILQDDGNMVIYKGNAPDDNQGLIWSSKTNGKQQQPNPNYVASKGKYGNNWIPSGSTLSPGDFVGSTDGSICLIMQNDGNLVLYTFNMIENCQKMSDGNIGGGIGANALYNIGKVGIQGNIGKVGYIDQDSVLKEYPDSMLGYINEYDIYPNTDSIGNDIKSFVALDETQCQIECNNTLNCAAYSYMPSTKTCWLKNNGAYPKGSKELLNDRILGIRKPKLISSTTCGKEIKEINTLDYNNYNKGTLMTPDTQCGVSLITQDDKIKLDNIKTKLSIIGNDIATKMETLYNEDNKIYEKINMNAEQFKNNLEKYKNINKLINQELKLHSNYSIEGMRNLNINNINGMLSDTDLKVLQGNYSYIMWSILAVGILTITINMMKK